jgi:CRP/FNR family transcriptional regulator
MHGDGSTARRTPRLSLSERIAVSQFGAKAHWPGGFEVYRSGTAADGVFVVLHGHIVLRTPMKGGRGFVSGMAMPGETFGAEGLAPRGCYVTDARAADGVETLHLGSEQFRAFMREQPAHAISLVGQIMAERSTLLERLQELASLNVEDRLVSVLIRLSEDTGFMVDDAMLKLDSSHHRLLCEMVGATRESIALALSRMVSGGVATRAGSCFVIDTQQLASRLHASRYDEQTPLPMTQESARA